MRAGRVAERSVTDYLKLWAASCRVGVVTPAPIGENFPVEEDLRVLCSQMHESIVILSSRRLFAEGVANRLRQYLAGATVWLVDPREPDPMGQVIRVRPTTVIMDITDAGVARLCPMQDLLKLAPQVQLIRLDPDRAQAQVVTSQEFPTLAVSDLAQIIAPAT